MKLLKKLYTAALSFKFKMLMRFMSDEQKSELLVSELEKLYKSNDNSLSETSVAIVASGLGVKTTAKRKRKTAKKKAKKKTRTTKR